MYDDRIIKIIKNSNYTEEVGRTVLRLFSLMQEHDLRGFCHASASILYICLCELGLKPELVLGEANIGYKYFDHSWICLDNKIIDLAIALPLDYSDKVGPVILNKDLYTNKNTIVEYGNSFGEDYGVDTKAIISTNFVEYMDCAPFELGLWSFVREALNRNVDIEQMRKKYQNVKRCVVNH